MFEWVPVLLGGLVPVVIVGGAVVAQELSVPGRVNKVHAGLLSLAAVAGTAYILVKVAEATRKTTVMFLTGAPWDYLGNIEPYFDGAKFNVWPWNYCFLDFVAGWGDYFNFHSTDAYINEHLAWFKARGFKNVLYVDPTEISNEIADRFPDSVKETGDWWVLMTLDPSKSWFQYLKAGMLGLTQRFGEYLDGFAIDRLDRAYTVQELAWACQLLDEVKAESQIPIEYVMNTLQSWQTEAARRAAFIGSDGVDVSRLGEAMAQYGALASLTQLKRYYLVGRNWWMPSGDEGWIEDVQVILSKHDFIFMPDYKASTFIPALFG
ncbi:hypothetical protein ES702_02489 [subsurface metagenome]